MLLLCGAVAFGAMIAFVWRGLRGRNGRHPGWIAVLQAQLDITLARLGGYVKRS